MKQQPDIVKDETRNEATTVYYDGSCPLCSLEIGHYKKQKTAGELSYVDVSATDESVADDLNRDTAMKRFHVRLPDGSLVSGARAFVAVWETMPKWKWAARLAKLPGVLPILELGYRMFLPVRPWLSRLAARLGARPETRQS